MGKNATVSAFAGIEIRYDIGESGKNLYTRYNDNK